MTGTVTLESLRLQILDAGLRLHRLPETRQMRAVRTMSPLAPHREYLRRWLDFVATLASKAGDANAYVVPTNAIFYQFANVYGHRYWFRRPDLRRDAEREAEPSGPRILLATGDFGQRKRSQWESHAPNRAYKDLWEWLDDRFTLLAFEATDDLAAHDLPMLPYPLHDSVAVHPAAHRDLLYSFAGALSYPQLPDDHIRGGRLLTIAGKGADWFVGTTEEARAAYGSAGSDIAMIHRSTFTLCPAGFGRWTFRLGQALRLGSIPVLLADGYRMPHSDSIDWSNCIITVNERDVDAVPDLLRDIPPSQVTEMQAALKAQAHLFTEQGVHLMVAKQLSNNLGLLPP